MVKPKAEYRIQRNGGSIQVFKLGSLVGSISLYELCEIVKTRNLIHTAPLSTQHLLKKQVLKLRGIHTTEEKPTESPDLKGKNSA